MPERFTAGLTKLPTVARVDAQRRALRWRIISTVISAVVLYLIVRFLGGDWSPTWTYVIVGLWVLSSVFWLTVSIVGYRGAKRDLASIPDGVAFCFDGVGVEFVTPVPAKVSWDDVTSLHLTGRGSGAGHCVAFEERGVEVAKVPLSFIDATPEVIDSAARAYSLGRVHLGVGALNRVL